MAPKNLKMDKNMLQPIVLDDSFLMPLSDISVCVPIQAGAHWTASAWRLCRRLSCVGSMV